ncbi:MAG TPA: DUF3987 domain-containing protein [Phycisphaerae bacterium]|nr:DUF3987 domain-containing protein [Phycisphaerae bacterium]
MFEVRAPNCRDRGNARYAYTCSGYFTRATLDAAVTSIMELDRAGIAPGIYLTLNPVSPALLARAANRIKPRIRETSQDKDIPCRRWLLIDVDPLRPAGVSATDAELALARERVAAIVEYLDFLGWPPPLQAMSGNGFHLLYRIDLPVDDDGLIKALLGALADQFSDEQVAVDRSVHNPARIVKVIGTMARKGDDLRGIEGVPDRPHRRSELLDVPADIEVVPEALLRSLVAATNAVAPTVTPTTGKNAARLECTPTGVRSWLQSHGVEVKGERRNGSKTLLLLERCPIDPEIVSNGGSDIAVLVGDDGKLAYCNKHNRGDGFTWHDLRKTLEPDYVPLANAETGVDLSGFRIPGAVSTDLNDDRNERSAPTDPGPLPDELLRIPGFVNEVMDHGLATAPYPNRVMAFCGAVALQAFLAGRKVRDPGDNRTNIYLLGLAHSAAGKDWPRKLNTRILHEAGLADGLGERFASGEGIQDALFTNPAMLFQTDEIDGMLQSINRSKDARHEAIMSTLLTIYSSANSVYPMRRKAGKGSPGVIDQPCLVIFGTAIPNHYYQALSDRMLTNGFFARMIILESGPRASGQEPSIRELPPRVLTTARWWAEFQPGEGNLQNWHPIPRVVEHDDAAKEVLVATRLEAEAEYAAAEQRNDDVGTTVWGRVNEQVRKLSLLYAISENHKSPCISLAAAEWATRFVMHQTRRMLFMAYGHVADNPFHAECLKLIQKLRKAPDHELPHHVLLKRMKIDSKSFRDLIETLVQRGDITIESAATEGRTRTAYRLAGER